MASPYEQDGKVTSNYYSIHVENDREELQEVQPTEGPLPLYSVEEVRKQLEKMGLNKACGPDDLPIEAVKILASYSVDHVTETMNVVMQDGMPRNWKSSRLVPIYKGKGSILECNNYRGIKLMSHTMKLAERLIEARLRDITEIANNQYGFRPGKSTTEPIFILRMMQEKYREKGQDLHLVFVDLEKAYDRVPRELIWWSLRKKNVPEGYIKVIQDMYKDSLTQIQTRDGCTDYFSIDVGLHQGSALSPLLFIIIMDVLASELVSKPPESMLFADDIVLCETSREKVEQELERWRDQFERHGLRISRTKTEYMPTPHKEENIKLGDGPIQTVKVFKYLGSMFAAEGGSETDVNNRVKVAWAKWREVSGVMCDKKMPIKLKDKIYKTIVKPAMIYGSECWAVKKNDIQKLHTTEMRMLRWARGKTKKDHIKNEDIWREANVEPMTTFLRKKRLRWYGHVLRKEGEDTTKKMLNMQVQGKRRRGRPKKRWLDNIREDMKEYKMTEDMAQDRSVWRMKTKAGPLLHGGGL